VGPRLFSFRALSSLGHGVNDLYSFVLPLVLPLLLKEYGLSYRLAGLVPASYLGIVAVSSYLFGRGSDRFSPWILVGGGFLLASTGFLGSGLSPSRAGVFSSLAAAAIGAGTFHPVIYALIDRLVQERPGRALGSFEVSGILSILAMYLAGGLLLAWLGWRGVLAAVGIPGLAVGALFLRQAKGGPRVAGTAPPAGAGGPAEGTGAPQEQPVASGMSGGAAARAAVAGYRPGGLVFFLSAIALRLLTTMAVYNFLPTYLAMGRHLPPSLAAYVSGALFAGGAAVVLWGRVADRGSPLAVLFLASGTLAPLVLVLSLRLPLWALLPVLFLFGAFNSGCGPSQNLVLSALGSSVGSGTTFGLLMAVVSLIGALSPALFGLLADQLGLTAAMRLLALPALAGWLVLLAFRRSAWSLPLRR
jgi:FSR family fosmidomycin resistance protein-like MFS transporter